MASGSQGFTLRLQLLAGLRSLNPKLTKSPRSFKYTLHASVRYLEAEL